MRGRGGHPAQDRRAGREPGGDGSRKRHGRHYTPVRLAEFLAERTLAHVRPGPVLSILDPACGDGELLLSVARVAAQRFPHTSLRLVGYDLDVDAVRVARLRSAGIGGWRFAGGPGEAIGRDRAGPARSTRECRTEFEWLDGDFLRVAEELTGPAFDVVITNPPYVRTQQLGAETAGMLSRRFGLSGRIDLTHPFVATVPRLLRSGGVLGLLCANRFLSTKAGANLRALLYAELPPIELYDLGDTRLFQAAVLPAVTIAVRGRAERTCRFVTAYEAGGEPVTGADLFQALRDQGGSVVEHAGRRIAVETGTLRMGVSATAAFDPAVPWRLSRPDTDAWLRRIGEATWRTFGQVAPVRVGIKTTADRVFISDHWDELPHPPEAELLRTLLTHNDIESWRIDRAHDTRVLYPYDLSQSCRIPVDLDEFPHTRAYLEQHRQILSGRDYLVGSGREWFEIWVPQRPRLWRPPKVVFPDISVTPRFALDRSGAVVNGDCYWISLADIGAEHIAYLLMGVANSTLGRQFYDAVCGNRLYAGRRRWITQYVTRLPVPDPDTAAARALIAAARAFAEGEIAPEPERLDECVAAAFGLRTGSTGLRPGGPS